MGSLSNIWPPLEKEEIARLQAEGLGFVFDFWSPLGKGDYYVDDLGDIEFRLKEPLEIP